MDDTIDKTQYSNVLKGIAYLVVTSSLTIREEIDTE